MPALNFKEIPDAGSGSGRDQFELFAREFLEFMGFKVIVGPDRGPDAGRDMVVEETRTGVGGETHVKWLVSCKHKAHSSTSVTPDDERDIHDRVKTHGCDGFLAVYSTIPSSGLATRLNALPPEKMVLLYDRERIERDLLASVAGLALAQRFFPESFARWSKENAVPAKLYESEPDLACKLCGKSLLLPEPHGMVVLWLTERNHVEHVYWCCKGRCDRELKQTYEQQGLIDQWEEVVNLALPVTYIRWIMSILNRRQSGMTCSEQAHEGIKDVLLCTFPRVSRVMTTAEEEWIGSGIKVGFFSMP
jgi:hypothetical protein